MLTKMNTGNGEIQGKGDEENQLTTSIIPISFFKRKKSVFHSSAKSSHEAEVSGEGKSNASAGETPSEAKPFYSLKAGFNRAQYESRDTGRSGVPSETTYKSFLISSIVKRGIEEASAEQKQDSVPNESASPNNTF
jgi:hypothetical protein